MRRTLLIGLGILALLLFIFRDSSFVQALGHLAYAIWVLLAHLLTSI